jgi:surface polysaccharide O-acyltransferase-like enzyme
LRKRLYQIDVIKVFAIFSVVSVHFLLNSGFYDISVTGWMPTIDVILRTIFITAVPLFIMATGFLMGDKVLSSSYIVKIWRTLLLYVIVSIIDWIGHTLILGSKISFSDALYGMLDFSTDSYAWYVEMYIGLYLLIPVLNAAWHYQSNEQYHLYILIISVILFFLPSLFNVFGKIMPDWWTAAYPIGYYYFGVYFKTYFSKIQKIPLKQLLFWSVTIFSVISLIAVNNNYGKIFKWTSENDYMGYQPFIVAIILFLLFLRLPFKREKQRKYKILTKISGMTLTIYLFSDLTDSIIYHDFKLMVPSTNNRLVWGPLIVICSFISATILSFIVEKILSKLSNTRKA